MKFTRLIIGLFALLLLLPMQVVAEYISDVEPSSWDYGTISATQIFSFSSLGPTPLAVSEIFLWGDNSFTISSVMRFDGDGNVIEELFGMYACNLEAGESIKVYVGFTESPGYVTSTLYILSNALNNSVVEVPLEGGEEKPTPQEMMDALLEFFDNSEENDICGVGPGQAGASHLRVFGRMLDAAADLIDAGDYAAACDELERAALKSDGVRPPDFIDCDGAITVNAMIGEVIDALGCE